MLRKKKLEKLVLSLFLVCAVVLGLVQSEDVTANVALTNLIKADKEVKAEKVITEEATTEETETTAGNSTNTAKANNEETIKSEQMDVTFSYGYGKKVKYGRNTRLQATITNRGEDFTGSFGILLPSEDRKSIVYKKEIVIPKQETKTVELTFPITFTSDKVEIFVKDDNDTVILNKKLRMNVEVNTNSIYLGILSDDTNSLSYISDIDLKPIILDSDTFPKEVEGLDMLDIIVVNAFNLDKLEESQYKALQQFIQNGGTLVLGMGGNGKQAKQLFENEYSAKAVNVGTDQQIKQEGLGNVCLFSFDLGLEHELFPTKGIEVKTKIRNTLSATKEGQLETEFNGMGSDAYYILEEGLNIINNNKIPKVQKYAIILIIYLIIVSPILYIILKKKDKRNYLWVGVPALSVLFSIIIYLFGSSTRLKEPIMNYLTISNYFNGAVQEEVEFRLMSPFNREYSVKIPKQYKVSSAYIPNWYNPNYELNQDYNIEFKYGAKENDVILKNCTSFESNYFKMTGTRKEESGLVADIRGNKFDYEGTVTNNTDHTIEKAVALVGKKAYSLGNIKAGETVDLKNCKSYSFDESFYYDDGLINNLLGKKGEKFDYNSESVELRREFYAMRYYLWDNLSKNCATVFGFVKQQDSIVNQVKIKKEGVHIVSYPIKINYQKGKLETVPDISSYYKPLSDSGNIDNMIQRGFSPFIVEVDLQGDKPKEMYYRNTKLLGNGDEFLGEVLLFDFKKQKYTTVFSGLGEEELLDLTPYVDKDNKMKIKFKTKFVDNMESEMQRLPELSVLKEVD